MDDAARVREKIDIVSLISEYIPLKKMGRNFTTNCPFHTEKSPSFVVSPERQIWHCFGCGKGGDVFTFLMEYENLDFIEALRILAKKTGIVLKENYSNLQSSQKDKFYKLNKIAQEFYNYVLLNHSAGKKALQYLLEKRKLNKGLIENFGLGFSPSGGTALSDYLISKKKYKKEDLIAAGLSFQRGSRVIDFFRGRIMFPLTDIRGNVVGFSGRITEQNTDGPKYINTKETLIYHKGRMFFGFDKAKEEIKERGFVIIMEGEFDVISSFKEGIKNSIAIKGTALTEEQATILSRVTEKVMLCLDRDLAGLEATKRSLAVLEKKGILSNVVVIDGGKDPDEILNNDPISFRKSVDSSISAYEFLIKEISKKYNKDSADGKRKITNEILPLISLVENEIVKEHYLKKLSQEIDTSIESLSRQFGKLDKEDSSNKGFVKKEEKERREVLEEYLLSLVIQAEEKEKLANIINDFVSIYKFKIKSYEKILTGISDAINEKMSIPDFSKTLPSELIESFNKFFLVQLPKFDSQDKYYEEVQKITKELKIIYFKQRVRDIGDKLKKQEFKSPEEKEKLKEDFSSIAKSLSAL